MKLTTRLVVLLGIATLSLPGPLQAQRADPRWQAFIGCWAPASSPDAQVRMVGVSTRVCVVPAQGTSAVDIISISAGTVVDRVHVDADLQPHPVTRDGCTGTETAGWSESGTRVYTSSALKCVGGITRNGTGVLSLTERYQWLDVRSVTTGKSSGISVGRFASLAANDSTGIPADVWHAVPAISAGFEAATLAASAPLTLADIADVATSGVESGVASAWLMERTRGLILAVDGKQLATLADQGVPPSVIDVVVAISHPARFALNPNGNAPIRAGDPALTRSARTSGTYSSPNMSSLGYYGYSPYDYYYGYGYGGLYSLYGYGYGGAYGYGRYGGYSPYGGSYYTGTQPVVVVIRDSGNSAPSHGRVVNGQGYTSGSQGTDRPASRGGSTAVTSGGSSGSSSSGSSSSSAGSSSGSSSSSGSGRTAVKKP